MSWDDAIPPGDIVETDRADVEVVCKTCEYVNKFLHYPVEETICGNPDPAVPEHLLVME
jgi:hypothetical protein